MPISLGSVTITAMFLGTTAISGGYLGTTQVFGGSTFSPSSLFAASEQGVWYDPSDVANLAWRRNLLTFSEQFDNAAWSKSFVTISANATTAPDGSMTADKLIQTENNTSHSITQTIVAPAGATRTAYAKAGGYNFFAVTYNNSATNSVTLNLTTGAITNIGANVTSQSATNVGDGWWRLSMTVNAAVTNVTDYVLQAPGFPAETGNGTDGIFIWGAQLELGTVATEYQRITDVNTEVVERFPSATLYQDTAGTTPVVTPGQTVALMLDKSKGLALGTELVVNGTFTTDTNWTKVGTATVSGGSGNLNASLDRLEQTLTVVVGRTYSVTLQYITTSGSSFQFQWDNGTGSTSLTLAGSGTINLVFTPSNASSVMRLRSTGWIGGIDNISVKELPGNHATQATAASRPTYGVVPLGGRRNQLLYSEQFDNAVWRLFRGTVSPDVIVAPNGTTTADSFVETATSGAHVIDLASTVAITAPTACVTSIYVRKNATRRYAQVRGAVVSGDAYPWVVVDTQTGSLTQNAAVTSSGCVDVDANWWRVFVGYTTGVAGGATPVFGGSNSSSAPATTSQYGASYLGDVSSSISLWGAQLELGSTATAYQRTTTQFDVTEAGVQSLSYLSFDGVDDGLVTSTVNFTATDAMAVWAGLRKVSDTARGTVVELTASAAANNGAFHLTAPNAASATYAFESKGTALTDAVATVSAAPITSVLCAYSDISADQNILRVNGAQADSDTGDQGTGNFSNAIVYIGRRAGTSLPANMQLYGLIGRGSATSAGDIGNTETWIAAKTGVTL